jgi:acyl carrier protein
MVQGVVFKEISRYLKCQLEDVSMDMKLEELGIDSLGAITILYELEDELGIQVPDDVFDSLKIVKDIVDQLENLLDKNKSV